MRKIILNAYDSTNIEQTHVIFTIDHGITDMLYIEIKCILLGGK